MKKMATVRAAERLPVFSEQEFFTIFKWFWKELYAWNGHKPAKSI